MNGTTEQVSGESSLYQRPSLLKSLWMQFEFCVLDKKTLSAEVYRALKEMGKMSSIMINERTCDTSNYCRAYDMYRGLVDFVNRQIPETYSDERRLMESMLAEQVSLEHDAAHHPKPSSGW